VGKVREDGIQKTENRIQEFYKTSLSGGNRRSRAATE